MSASESTTSSRPTPDRILDAAEKLFSEQGFAATTLRQVTRATGMSQPNIYNHFEDKQALYDGVLERAMGLLFGTIEAAVQREGATSAHAIEATGEVLGRDPGLARLLYHEVARGAPDLERVCRGWSWSLLAAALADLDADEANRFEDEDHSLLLVAFFNLVIGSFATAHAFHEHTADETHEAESIEHKTRFLVRTWQRIVTLHD
ncbi:MAG: TetR/AcrR family transcriptional regulator [Myxococcota bacterium]|jgi:AcrR family transcriptional regulator|nr:TetR/AcrR family transcriptional regulator [Myxococcota bacterium]